MASISINPVKQPSFTSKFVTKDQLTNIFTYKGSVDNYADLPNENLKIGDVYNVVNEYISILDNKHYPAGTNWVWNGTEWDPQSGDITAQINSAINKLNVEDKAIEGQYISSVSESAGKIKVTHSEFPPFKPVWDTLRDYSKEYFTVTANCHIIIATERIKEGFWAKKLNLSSDNTNTDELNWYIIKDNAVFLYPGETVILKATINSADDYYDPKISPFYIYMDPMSTMNVEAMEITIYGNIASLIYGDDFIGKTSWPDISQRFMLDYYFQGTMVTDASNLVLPFMDFASYTYMFSGCNFLKKAPKILPLINEHDRYSIGYAGMFQYCSSLEESPIICAQSFVNAYGSCGNMFEGCSKLRKITMLATNFLYGGDPWDSTFYNWVNGVAPEGVFIKNKDVDLSILPRGKDTIPEGWVIEDYEE